jgi:hypothetical protein
MARSLAIEDAILSIVLKCSPAVVTHRRVTRCVSPAGQRRAVLLANIF